MTTEERLKHDLDAYKAFVDDLLDLCKQLPKNHAAMQVRRFIEKHNPKGESK